MSVKLVGMPVNRRKYREDEMKAIRDWTDQVIAAIDDFNKGKGQGYEIQTTTPYNTTEGDYLLIIMWKPDLSPEQEALNRQINELNERDAQQLATLQLGLANHGD